MNPVENKLNEARALAMKRDYAPALAIYNKLCRQLPREARLLLEYANTAGSAGEIALAEQLFAKAAALQPNDSQILLEIGHCYNNIRQPDKALPWYEKSAAADPAGINPRIAIAMLEEQRHRFDEARAAVAACLAIDPKDDQARYFAALIDRRENKNEDAERRLRALIASNPRHQYVQYASRYELAEVLNRTGRFDEAMQLLFEAKDIVRRLANVDNLHKEYDEFMAGVLGLTQAYPPDILKKFAREFPERERDVLPRFAFLGGHPRSGTTLLEQILGAHPAVAAFDEFDAFTRVVGRLSKSPPPLNAARINVIRRRYAEDMEKEWGASLKDKLILDKNPSPTIRLHHWVKIFPDLRILIALRDPRDVVISCFFQNIPLNPINANFLTLERTARHYASLMDIWLTTRKWEGLNALETKYEDIVADMEKEGRRATEFLGLQWDAAQARFYEKSREKRLYSPTYHDASQPVYTRSVARWRAYEKYLAPALPILEPYCRAFGYE